MKANSKIPTWVAVDKDGTEKISNNIFIRRKGIVSVLWGWVRSRGYSKNQGKKWGNCWSNDEKDVLPFMGVILPRGTIEKLIGYKLTWEDEPVQLS